MLCHDPPSNDPHGCARDGAHGRARAHHSPGDHSTKRIHIYLNTLLCLLLEVIVLVCALRVKKKYKAHPQKRGSRQSGRGYQTGYDPKEGTSVKTLTCRKQSLCLEELVSTVLLFPLNKFSAPRFASASWSGSPIRFPK